MSVETATSGDNFYEKMIYTALRCLVSLLKKLIWNFVKMEMIFRWFIGQTELHDHTDTKEPGHKHKSTLR